MSNSILLAVAAATLNDNGITVEVTRDGMRRLCLMQDGNRFATESFNTVNEALIEGHKMVEAQKELDQFVADANAENENNVKQAVGRTIDFCVHFPGNSTERFKSEIGFDNGLFYFFLDGMKAFYAMDNVYGMNLDEEGNITKLNISLDGQVRF